MLKVVQLRSIELHELLLTEKTGKREADEARKVEEWRQVGGRDQRGNSLAQHSAPLFPMASPLPGLKQPLLPLWQMELLIAFEVIGVTLHTRELQAQLQLST